MIALDLGEGQTRIPSAAWNRLKHAAERQRTAVIVATPWSTVGAFAATAIGLQSQTQIGLVCHGPILAAIVQ